MSPLFLLHLNTCLMGLLRLLYMYICYSFSVGIDLRRRIRPILTSKVGPRAERVNIFRGVWLKKRFELSTVRTGHYIPLFFYISISSLTQRTLLNVIILVTCRYQNIYLKLIFKYTSVCLSHRSILPFLDDWSISYYLWYPTISGWLTDREAIHQHILHTLIN